MIALIYMSTINCRATNRSKEGRDLDLAVNDGADPTVVQHGYCSLYPASIQMLSSSTVCKHPRAAGCRTVAIAYCCCIQMSLFAVRMVAAKGRPVK